VLDFKFELSFVIVIGKSTCFMEVYFW